MNISCVIFVGGKCNLALYSQHINALYRVCDLVVQSGGGVAIVVVVDSAEDVEDCALQIIEKNNCPTRKRRKIFGCDGAAANNLCGIDIM